MHPIVLGLKWWQLFVNKLTGRVSVFLQLAMKHQKEMEQLEKNQREQLEKLEKFNEQVRRKKKNMWLRSMFAFFFAICHSACTCLTCMLTLLPFNMICFFQHSFWNHIMQTNRVKVGISISISVMFPVTSPFLLTSLYLNSSCSEMTHNWVKAEKRLRQGWKVEVILHFLWMQSAALGSVQHANQKLESSIIMTHHRY